MTTEESQRTGRIVVGIDGSPAATAALEWAAAMADSTGAAVEVIATWQWPTGYGAGPMYPAEYDPSGDAARIVRKAVGAASRDHPGVEFVPLVVEGHPAQVLVDASRGAQLLALGTRGRGELGGLLLGSVTEHCAAHAHCPVLVLRARD